MDNDGLIKAINDLREDIERNTIEIVALLNRLIETRENTEVVTLLDMIRDMFIDNVSSLDELQGGVQ